MLMTSHPCNWAVEMVTKHGIATFTRLGRSPNGINATLNLGSTLECFTAVVSNSNELQAAKSEQDAKKSKMGQDKLMDFMLHMEWYSMLQNCSLMIWRTRMATLSLSARMSCQCLRGSSIVPLWAWFNNH